MSAENESLLFVSTVCAHELTPLFLILRYLWPLIHYHKFLAKCIKKLKRNGVDVKVTVSPVAVFLREEVCAVSDHLSSVSLFSSEQWMACLQNFHGWTDPKSEERLRGLVSAMKLRPMDEPGDVESPLLRDQIDAQFLRAMVASRESMTGVTKKMTKTEKSEDTEDTTMSSRHGLPLHPHSVRCILRSRLLFLLYVISHVPSIYSVQQHRRNLAPYQRREANQDCGQRSHQAPRFRTGLHRLGRLPTCTRMGIGMETVGRLRLHFVTRIQAFTQLFRATHILVGILLSTTIPTSTACINSKCRTIRHHKRLSSQCASSFHPYHPSIRIMILTILNMPWRLVRDGMDLILI